MKKEEGEREENERTDGTSTLGVSVEFGDDHSSDIDGLTEGLGLVERSLTDRSVHHKDDLIGGLFVVPAKTRIERLSEKGGMRAEGKGWTHDGSGNLSHLFKERFLLLVTTTRVDDDDLKAVPLELLDSVVGDLDGIGLCVASVEGHLDLGGVLFELIKGSGTERVCAHNARQESLSLVMQGQL